MFLEFISVSFLFWKEFKTKINLKRKTLFFPFFTFPAGKKNRGSSHIPRKGIGEMTSGHCSQGGPVRGSATDRQPLQRLQGPGGPWGARYGPAGERPMRQCPWRVYGARRPLSWSFPCSVCGRSPSRTEEHRRLGERMWSITLYVNNDRNTFDVVSRRIILHYNDRQTTYNYTILLLIMIHSKSYFNIKLLL